MAELEMLTQLNELIAEYNLKRQDIYNQYVLLAEAVFDGEITEEDDLRSILYGMSDFYIDSRFCRLGDRLASYIHRFYPQIISAMGYGVRLPTRPSVDAPSILKEAHERCEEAFPGKVADTILYGSYARGNPDAESDINIMVLVDISEQLWPLTRYPIYQISSQLSLKYDVTVSIAVRALCHWEEHKDSYPLYQNILMEGKSYKEY